jgi:ABC-2 type transport system permease protein
MKSLAIALKDTKILIRDRSALLVMLAMPLTIIAILGMALGGLWSGEAAINKFDVAVVDYDHGNVSKVFIDNILGSKDMKKILNVTGPTEAKARASVANGDLAAAIIIPKGFSDTVNRGEDASIEVLADPGQEIRAGVVRSVTEAFATHASSVLISVKSSVETLVGRGAVPPAKIGALSASLAAQAQKELHDPQISVAKKSAKEEKSVNALQYYSAGMGVMFILFGSMFGAFSLLEERRQITLARMLAAPASKLTILTGKLGGIFIIGALQFMVLVAATRVLFGVNWGSSVSGVILLAASTVLAATGMAIFIASVTRSQGSAAGVSQGLIQGMAALGGSMMPLSAMPPAMLNFSKFTINYWAVSGFNDLMLGKGLETIGINCLALIGFAVFFMALGIARFRYE